MAATITGRSGRHYKTVDPNAVCDFCGKSAKDMGAKTKMAFAIHQASHVRSGEAKWRRRGNVKKLVPNRVRIGADAEPIRVGDIRDRFNSAVGDFNKAMALVQFATILPKVPAARIQRVLADLTRRYDK